jgi:EpsI family protein
VWKPNFPGADHFVMTRYSDGMGAQVDLVIAVYSSQREGKELVGFGQGAIRENDSWVRIEDLPALEGGSALRMTAPGPVEREVVTWYRVGDVVTGSPSRVKAETLKAKLLGGRQRAVAVMVSAEKGDLPTRAAIKRFLGAMPPVDVLADWAAGVD